MASSGALPPLGPAAAGAAGPRPGSGNWEGWRRAAGELERSLRFVQQQHAETLRELHAEVEALRRRNRDLQHQLVMREVPAAESPGGVAPSAEPRPSSSGGGVDANAKGRRSWKAEEPERRRQRQPERSEEAAGAQAASASAAAVSAEGGEEARKEATSPSAASGGRTTKGDPAPQEALGQHQLESEPEPDSEPESKAERDAAAAAPPPRRRPEVCDRMTSPILFPSASPSTAGEAKIPAASSNPFLVNVLPSYMRKPPTLEECEVVIRQLWSINHMQMQELMYLRSCLEDIHKTKRIPEDYMLAGQLGLQGTSRFPRMKKSPKKCRVLTPLPAAERAVLPALKQTLGNAFAERQKRTQAVQRNRLHRTAL